MTVETLINLLWLVGLALWVCGMWEASRLERRYRAKKGTELYPLREMAERYLERPWRWPLEAPRATVRLMRIGTTPHADPELEKMRVLSRRFYRIGLTLILVAMVLFLVAALAAARPG